MRTIGIAALAVAAAACGTKEDPQSYARKAAEESEPKRGPSQIEVFRPAVPKGKRVACESLLGAATLTAALGRGVELIDKWSRASAGNAACVVVAAGKADEYRKAAATADDAIGQTLGLEDAVCRIEASCHLPLDEPALRKRCDREIAGGVATDVSGAFACISKQSTKDRNSKLMESGRVEHVKWAIKAFEPDTHCELTVYALDDEALARSCARAAVDTIDKTSIAEFE
jgi:hypothetical protein